MTANREITLDGLRGMAALMVATTHAALCCDWITPERPHILLLLAPIGVIIFFMLTGYLFWNRARMQNGVMEPWKLWRERLYRIAPLYLFSLFFVLLLAVNQHGAGWLTIENWRPISRLFTLGAMSWHDVGGIKLGEYNAGVVWTLWYEWNFYLILPFIAWMAIGKRVWELRSLLIA